MSIDLGTERLAIVGATGAVGREALRILEEWKVRPEQIVACASARSEGKSVEFGGERLPLVSVEGGRLPEAAYVLHAASAEAAREYAPAFVERGAWVVDNSSAFRMRAGIPLVVPEINGALLEEAAERPSIIANPNCSTIILLVALEGLRRAFGVKRIVVSTYQAVSGAGQAAMDELQAQAGAVLRGEEARPAVFREPCAFNLFSHDSAVETETGVNGEERKIIEEARKIWNAPDLSVSPTCIRVPVLRAHTEAATVTLETAASEAEVRRALADATGVRIIDDRANNRFPTPLRASGCDEVLVGRVRPDPGTAPGADGRTRQWSLLACGDQLRKGAALNALQIIARLASLRDQRSGWSSEAAGSAAGSGSCAPSELGVAG